MTLATLAEASSNIVETMLKGKVLMYVTTGDSVTQRKFLLMSSCHISQGDLT